MSIMKNFLEETKADMRDLKKTFADIKHIGDTGSGVTMSVNEFKRRAKEINYDSGFGQEEINLCLVIVFKDGSWLERYEYDGAEHWEYKYAPNFDHKIPGKVELCSRPQTKKKPKREILA